MERGGFNGYHPHNSLPRLSSSSDMNHHHQGRSTHDPNMINGNPHMINPTQNNITATKTKIMRNSAAGSDQEHSTECTVREQDRFMPIANVIRIMRRTLPPHAKISDDAKETIQECVSEFIGFVTGEANDRCQREQRKTITAEDVLFAMSKLGFDDYVDPLSLFLHRFREMESGPDLLRASASSALVKRPSSSSSAPNYDYGGNYPFAHQIYHNVVHPPPPGGGYYGPPPQPGFEQAPYGQHNKG